MKLESVFIAIVLIVALGFGVYANSLGGKFLWDDDYLIKDNVDIKNLSQIPKFFTQGVGSSAGLKSTSYRPLCTVTYAVNYFLSKLNVRPYHFTNILLHVLTALCIYWLLNLIFKDKLLSLFASVLFVVHPIHTEAVAYISGRADSLATLFLLLSFIFYIRHCDPPRHRHCEAAKRPKQSLPYILALATYVLALFSRENSLILPALLCLYHFTFKKRLRAERFLPILGITFAYILLRTMILKNLLPAGSPGSTLFERVPGFFAATLIYIKLLFLPLDLRMAYGSKLFSLADPWAISGAFITLSLLIYAFKERKRNNLVFFSILWFFIALLPSSNLYPLNAYMAEHWLYLPSIGFFLILAKAILSLGSLSFPRKRESKVWIPAFAGMTSRFGSRVGMGILILLTSIFSYLTVKQNRYWRDPVVFSQRMLKYTQGTAGLYSDLGKSYNDAGRYEEALPLLKKAVESRPNHAEAYNNLGNSLAGLGRKEDAISAYKKAIELRPGHAKAHYNIGVLYHETGNPQEAITHYEKANDINPNYVECHYNLGIAYHEIGNHQDAISSLKNAIKLVPSYAEAYNNLGSIYHKIGRKEEAIFSYEKAIALKPNHAAAYFNVGLTYYELGKRKEAIAAFKKTIKFDPSKRDAYNNLAAIYYEEREYRLAIKYCDRLVELGHKSNPELLKKLEEHRK